MIVLIGGKLAPIASFKGSADGSLTIAEPSIVKDVQVLPGDYKDLSRDIEYFSVLVT